MFITGQKVVCINDKFPNWALVLYDNLPIKNIVYTIRSASMGRSEIKDEGLDSMVECVTLVELKNGVDPFYKGGVQELQFKAERFRPVQEKKTYQSVKKSEPKQMELL